MSDIPVDIYCALLSLLLKEHAYGTPVSKEKAVKLSAVARHDEGKAKDAFEELREEPFITDRGSRGIELNNSEFERLVEFLYQSCDWSEFDLKVRVKHYEGWSNHEWAS